MKTHRPFPITVTIREHDLKQAYNNLPLSQFTRIDDPTEIELCVLRVEVGKVAALDTQQTQMISLHWLRNWVVKFRKAGELQKKKHGRSTNKQQAGYENGGDISLFS